MKNFFITLLFFLLVTVPAFANNLVISNVTLEDRNASANTLVVQFNISWDHSWRKPDGRHDAVWVFVKLYQNSTAPWVHGKLYTAGTNPVGTSPGTNSDLKIVVPSDKIGAFISRTATGSGSYSSQKVRLVVDYGSSGIADTDTVTAKVFGIEMTYIPEGPFYIGDAVDNHDLNEVVGTSVYASNDAFISIFNSSGTFQWSRRLGGTSIDRGYAVARDSSDNIIAAGTVGDKADLNGDGDTADTNENASGAYISIFNSLGTFQWSKRFGGTGGGGAQAVSTDSANIIGVGYISGNADLNGDGDTADANETGNTGVYGGQDAFISVFNSSGTFQWSKRLGGTASDAGGLGVSVSSNNVITVGAVTGNADLNGDGDTADSSETGGGVYGVDDGFISVFNSAGTFQWSKRLGGAGQDYSYASTVDSSNNIIVVGFITGNADLNGDSDTADTNETGNTGVYAGQDAFISVFNSAGTFQWSKRLGGTVTDNINSVAVDSSSNIIVAGAVSGNVDLNGDGDTADTNESGAYQNSDIFISVFNSAGTFQWSKRLGGTGSDSANSVAVDSSANIMVVGAVVGNGDLNGDGDTADSNETGNTGVYGGNDPIISVFNSAGTFQWSKRLGGTASEIGYGVVADSNNNVIATGTVVGNADLNGNAALSVTSSSFAFYQSGYEDAAAQITTTAKSITVDSNSNDDIDTSPIAVTGLAGIAGNTSWPNGYGAFYLMKYEISQGQYVDFLNTLSRVQQGNRVTSTISGNTISSYYVMTGDTSVTYRLGIRAPASGNGTSPTTVVFGNDFNGNGTFNEADDGASIAMDRISWMDGAAYADWAGLRPFTELEYEKAARGPNSPVYGEYAWGTTNITRAVPTTASYVNSGRGSETTSQAGEGLCNYSSAGDPGPLRVGFAATNATNRKNAGAGYYGNMELTGNLVERIVTLGNTTGRAFTGTHGDGTLTTTASYEGNATNNDWPGIDATTARGVSGSLGSGSRGGSIDDPTTYLPVSYRAAASSSYSSRNYYLGFRAARTAP